MANKKSDSLIPVLNEPSADEQGTMSRMFHKIKKDPAVFLGICCFF